MGSIVNNETKICTELLQTSFPKLNVSFYNDSSIIISWNTTGFIWNGIILGYNIIVNGEIVYNKAIDQFNLDPYIDTVLHNWVIIDKLLHETTYYINMQILNSVGLSGWSNTTVIRTGNIYPNTPTNLSVLLSFGWQNITIEWDSPIAGGIVFEYNIAIHRINQNDTYMSYMNLTSNITYKFTSINDSGTYCVQVQSTNDVGTSEYTTCIPFSVSHNNADINITGTFEIGGSDFQTTPFYNTRLFLIVIAAVGGSLIILIMILMAIRRNHRKVDGSKTLTLANPMYPKIQNKLDSDYGTKIAIPNPIYRSGDLSNTYAESSYLDVIPHCPSPDYANIEEDISGTKQIEKIYANDVTIDELHCDARSINF